MVTASNTSSVGAAFTKAPNHSTFRKVFLNNMDWNSFTSDTKKQIAMINLNSKTAIFNVHSALVAEQEYTNCQVNKIFLQNVSSMNFIDL